MSSSIQQALDLDLPASRAASTGDELRAEAIPGLALRPAFIAAHAEQSLLSAIDAQPWMTSMQRRVQHYGWRYDYRARRVRPDAYLGPLPDFLSPVLQRLDQELRFKPDQAIINEYEPGQGIAPHIDCLPCFGPRLVMLGLGSDVQMDFAPEGRTNEDRPLVFPARSLLVLDGEARSRWMHSIAKRKTDAAAGIRRARRVSITFRTVIPS